MSRRDKVVTLALVGGILILLGVLSKSWWSVEGGTVGMGLRAAKICVGDFGCATVGYDSAVIPIDDLPASSAAFFRYAKSTYWVGLLAAVLLFVHGYLVRKGDERRVLGYAAAGACASVVLLGVAAAAAFPDDLSDVASRGWSMWCAMFGCVLGAGSAIPKLIPTSAVMGARNAVGAVGDKVHRAALGPLADLDKHKRPDPKAVPKARVHKD